MIGTVKYPQFSIDDGFRDFIESMITALLNESDHDKHLDILLDGAIEFYKADRAYIIEGDFEPVCAINTHERVAPGKPYQQDTLKDLPTSAYVRWGDLFLEQEPIVIEDMEMIRDSLPGEYRYFTDSDVHGIIVVPFSRHITRGFIGVDNPKRYKNDTLTLRVLSQIIAEELTEIKLMDENRALKNVSAYPDNLVQVKLFGQFEIKAKGGALPSKALSGKGKMILELMLLIPDVRFDTSELYELLSSDVRDPEKQSVPVQNTIYRIRSKLDTIGLKELILNEDGTYYLNPEFDVDSDVRKFRRFYRDMKSETNEAEKLKIAEKAMGLYIAPLSASLCDSFRFEMEAMDLNSKFMEIAKWYAESCISGGNYVEADEIAHRANRVDPHDGSILLLMARIKKLCHTPGLRAFAKRIRQKLTEEECAELEEIIK